MKRGVLGSGAADIRNLAQGIVIGVWASIR
jgi:hypothetical protein